MSPDDDIAAQLPEPPPPAPLRRQGAIDEALRRFDAAHGAQPIAEPLPAAATREPWWAGIGRPQAAALVTAGLVALFGVPAAWLSVSQQSKPVSQTQLASADNGSVAQTASKPLIELPSDKPAAEVPPTAVSALKPEQPAIASGALLAKDEAKERDARNVPDAVAASAAPIEFARAEPGLAEEPRQSMIRAKQAYASRADQPVRLADAAPPRPATPMAAPPPPPPPPPPAMTASVDAVATASSNFSATAGGQAAKASGSGDMIVSAQRRAENIENIPVGSIVVTAQRRTARKSAGRGDWNACTINDPARNLQRCKGQVNPASAGPTGWAAAHVADGLTRAWQGDLDGAIADFDQAIATAPRYAIAYLNRGLALQRKGEFSRASADLDRAVRYAPGAARGYYNRSQLLRQRGEADRANVDEDRAVALDPDYMAVVE